MARNKRAATLSAQQLDPLGWFGAPYVPLVLGAIVLLYGAVLSALTWPISHIPFLQPIATVICAGACLVIHIFTRPLRKPIGWGVGVAAIALSTAGVLVSAIGYYGTRYSVELWWASGAIALTIGSLGPYLAARRVLVLGAAAMAAMGLIGLGVATGTGTHWSGFETAVIINYSVVLGTAATATFSWLVVRAMLPMLASPAHAPVAGTAMRDAAAKQMETVNLARLTARAAPFLLQIADAGRITPSDRALAGQLARRLRDELVTQSNLSWLDSIASELRLVVVDPDRRARSMNGTQRTALRGLLRAIAHTPGTDAGSLRVELRAAADGATAVGVSLDMALPDGKRIMHLAPYYLTLKTAVEDFRLEQHDFLRLSFRLPAEQAGSPRD